MSIEKTIFGTTKDGREVTAYTLRNIRGMRVKISSLGAAIVSVEMKDFAGERKDIVLGYDKVSDYEENGTFFGAARRRRLTARPATSCCWTSSAGRCSPTGDPITATTSTPGAPGHRPGTTNGRPPTPGKNASTNQAP